MIAPADLTEAINDMMAIQAEHQDHLQQLAVAGVRNPADATAALDGFATQLAALLPDDATLSEVASFSLAVGFIIGTQAQRRAQENA